MKKTITRPDGSIVVVEGTPEEIAEYERKLQLPQGEVHENPKKGPGLLNEENLKLLEAAIKRFETPTFYPLPQHTPECEITVASRGWWCVNPPRCTCGLFVYPTLTYPIYYRYVTWPVTTDKIQIGDVIPDPYVITCNATGP